MFGDVVRPELATLGSAMSREDLDAGKKQDEDFFSLVAAEYNKKGVMSYDANAFPSIPWGNHYAPYNFSPIDWKKARESFKALCNEYDIAFKHWKISGFHGDIPVDMDLIELTEIAEKPYSDFIKKNTSLLYMHQFVYQFPDILTKVSG